MYTSTYGQVLAANVDPIEKKPIYHFMPGHKSYSIALAGCNFRCDFCQNWQISQADERLLKQSARLPYTSPRQVVEKALQAQCQSISYTYTEPIVYWEYALDCMQLAGQAGLANVVVSNGYGSALAWQAANGLMQAANIDLKAFNADFYRQVCAGRLEVVLDSLRQLKAMGVWLEVTTLIVPGLNDSAEELHNLARFIADQLSPETPWHISAYHPNFKRNTQPTGVKQLMLAQAAGQAAGLKYIYLGNVTGLNGSDTLCPQCSKTLIQRRGFAITGNALHNTVCGSCGCQPAGVWHE